MRFRFVARLAPCLLAVAAAAAPPPLPATPSATRLELALPFRLAEPVPVPGRPDLEPATDGWIIVVAADPAACFPRQTAAPILYVGSVRPARVNHGWPAGHVVAIVVGVDDLADTPTWFGSPGLPEQAGPAVIAQERELAERSGIRGPSAAEVVAALAAGGDALEVASIADLWSAGVRELVLRFDPDWAGSRQQPSEESSEDRP